MKIQTSLLGKSLKATRRVGDLLKRCVLSSEPQNPTGSLASTSRLHTGEAPPLPSSQVGRRFPLPSSHSLFSPHGPQRIMACGKTEENLKVDFQTLQHYFLAPDDWLSELKELQKPVLGKVSGLHH